MLGKRISGGPEIKIFSDPPLLRRAGVRPINFFLAETLPVSSSTSFDSTVAPASIQNVSHPDMAGSKLYDDMTRKGMSCTIEWWITF